MSDSRTITDKIEDDKCIVTTTNVKVRTIGIEEIDEHIKAYQAYKEAAEKNLLYYQTLRQKVIDSKKEVEK